MESGESLDQLSKYEILKSECSLWYYVRVRIVLLQIPFSALKGQY
jgi:hypothetical protein